MNTNRKNMNKLISKALNETLEERAGKIVSKLKSDLKELGGMEDEHPIFGKLNAGKMSRKEMSDLMKKHYGKGFDDEEDSEEDESSTEDDGLGIPDDMPAYKTKYRYSDEDESDFRDMKSFRKRKDYRGMAESHDSEEMYISTGGKKYNPKTYKNLPLGKGEISIDDELLDDLTGSEPIRYMSNDIKRMMRKKRDMDDDYNDMEFAEGKGETCEQCGSPMMNESECSECGYKMEGIYDVDDIDDKNEFDYVEEEMHEDFDEEDSTSEQDVVDKKCQEYGEDSIQCKKHKEYAGMGGELDEKLHGRQKNLDKNKNGRLDAADFKMLRAMKGKKKETDEEVEEGNAFTGALAKAKKSGKDEFEVGGKKFDVTENKKGCKVCGMKNCKCNHKKNKKSSVNLEESELISLIEDVILEQKEKLKNVGGQPRGLQKYKQSHEKSGKENKDYLSSVGKKMKDYLKDGSNGDYDMEPKMFPKNNGQLKKMKTHKYTMSDDGKEFLDDYMRPGMESLVPDEIQFDDKWVSDGIEGSSRTGNNPKWANAEETDLGEKINKKRKGQKYHKAKMAAYRKTRVPVTDGTGENAGKGVDIKLESVEEKETKKINEEFDRMKDLISYDRKTQ